MYQTRIRHVPEGGGGGARSSGSLNGKRGVSFRNTPSLLAAHKEGVLMDSQQLRVRTVSIIRTARKACQPVCFGIAYVHGPACSTGKAQLYSYVPSADTRVKRTIARAHTVLSADLHLSDERKWRGGPCLDVLRLSLRNCRNRRKFRKAH